MPGDRGCIRVLVLAERIFFSRDADRHFEYPDGISADGGGLSHRKIPTGLDVLGDERDRTERLYGFDLSDHLHHSRGYHGGRGAPGGSGYSKGKAFLSGRSESAAELCVWKADPSAFRPGAPGGDLAARLEIPANDPVGLSAIRICPARDALGFVWDRRSGRDRTAPAVPDRPHAWRRASGHGDC